MSHWRASVVAAPTESVPIGCVQLADTEEWIDGVMAGNLGEVLIRYASCYLVSTAPTAAHTSGTSRYLADSLSMYLLLRRCNNVLYIRGADPEVEDD